MIEQEIRSKIKKYKVSSRVLNVLHPNQNDKSTRFLTFKDDGDHRFRIHMLTSRLILVTPLSTSLLFSINIPDRVCLANKLISDPNEHLKVYTDRSKDAAIAICIELLEKELHLLNLNPNEGLTVYANSLQLTLDYSRALLPEIESCKRIRSIIEKNYPDKDKRPDYSDLPADLRQIVCEFETWAITDDFDRSEKIRELTEEQRSHLIGTIEPKFGDIHSFLQHFGSSPLTDGAIVLQSLAKLVSELINDR